LSLSFVFTHCTLSLLITKPGCSMVFSSLHIKETKLKKNWMHFFEGKTWWLPNYSHFLFFGLVWKNKKLSFVYILFRLVFLVSSLFSSFLTFFGCFFCVSNWEVTMFYLQENAFSFFLILFPLYEEIKKPYCTLV